MKLINPKAEIIEQQPGIEGIYKQIEIAGRTAYKSEDRITDDSAKKFVDMLTRRGHGAALEHGTVYLKGSEKELFHYDFNNYSVVIGRFGDKTRYVTTNFRVLVENDWLDDLKYLCEPTEYHEKRITARFTCDRGVSHEFVRHRVFSFMQESTRYCNYSLGKFGSELTFIIPSWLPYVKEYNDGFGMPGLGEGVVRPPKDTPEYNYYLFGYAMSYAEEHYFELLNNGRTPQEARQVLPNAIKTELIMTGTIEQWKGFFKLRCAPDAHPDARYLAEQTKKLFINKGYING